MDDIDRVLARLAAVSVPVAVSGEPAFLDRLRASGERGVAVGVARCAVMGLLVAATVLAADLQRASHGANAGFLYATAGGQLL